jgi:hypothetical protein
MRQDADHPQLLHPGLGVDPMHLNLGISSRAELDAFMS